ncbi:MAG: glycosyltransferase family 4 protein [Acidiferrobacterales bacterium]|nr:glycosyltransferase family 4 protein [Acidiferrobacterales bacterium]
MTIDSDYQLLAIGPLPPPLAGTSVSFKLFCDFLATQSEKVSVKIISTAPKKLGTRPLLDLSNLVTASRILTGCLSHIRKSNKVILFGSNQFLLSMMPICLLIAKLARKKFYVRSFGGSLDSYYLNLSPYTRKYFRWMLNHTDGLIVQTDSLNIFFENLLDSRVHLVPGYRELPKDLIVNSDVRENHATLKLVYVGHINKQKGIFDLLDTINMLNADRIHFECDIYGPIYDEDSTSFKQLIAQTNGAHYSGILDPNQVIKTISSYDLFVFPTYYSGEGHPGVLIEAMMAGLPIITTNFKSIPDLVEHRINGLLVAPNNPQELAIAIQLLKDDRELMNKLKEQSALRGIRYSSEVVIPSLLKAIEIEHK